MSDPVATPDDLALHMGIDPSAIDQARATYLLRQAQKKCERYISPKVLGDDTGDIVCGIAARAYNNPMSATQIGMGSAYASIGSTSPGMGVGGLFLSKQDKSELRRATGYGGAFSIDLLPRGTCEVQSVEVAATAGTFTLTFCEQTTATIAWDATAAQVQSALEALSSIGAGNALVDGSFTVSFRNGLGYRSVPQIRADDSDLTGVVSVATLEQGSQPAWGG